MNWEAITAVSTAFTGIVIAVTALVGISQLRQLRDQRRDSAVIELARSIQDTDFTRSFRLILSVSPGTSAADLRARGVEYEEAAHIVGLRFELLGVLIFRGTIAFDVMEDLAGGATVSAWRRLEAWVDEIRAAQNYPMYFEWFQWLAEQFERRHRLEQTPAHLRHRTWNPT